MLTELTSGSVTDDKVAVVSRRIRDEMKPRLPAQRPLPSMMIAICRGGASDASGDAAVSIAVSDLQDILLLMFHFFADGGDHLVG